MKSKVRYQLSDDYMYSTQLELGDGIARQVLAAVVYGIHLRYQNEPKDVVQAKVDEIIEDTKQILTMPPVMGNRIEGDAVIDKMSKEYGIDFNSISTITIDYDKFVADGKKDRLEQSKKHTEEVMKGNFTNPLKQKRG